jgi:hypothetical protein
MVVNFKARGISRGARKLVRTPMLIKKKKEIYNQQQPEDITNLEKKQKLSTASKDGELKLTSNN